MKITLSATFTEKLSTSLTGRSDHEDTKTISLHGEPAEIQRIIDEMFDAEQATALRRVWGLKQPQVAEAEEVLAKVGDEENEPSGQRQSQTIEDAVMDIRRLLIYTLAAISSAGLAEATRDKSLRLPLG